MKCNKCGAKWEVNAKFENCPFCGESLIEETAVPDKNTSLGGVIKYIADKFGADIFRDRNKCLSVFNDLAPQMKNEKKLFSIALDEKIPQIFIETAEQGRETAVLSIQRSLDFFMKENAVDIIISAFSEAFGWEKYQTAAPEVSQPEPAPAPLSRAEEAFKKGMTAYNMDDIIGYRKAFEYFQEAYDAGDHKDAACMLGMCYYDGNGTNQDYSKAFKYFSEAFNNGDYINAAYMLGEFYYNQDNDEEQAIKWYKTAYKRGKHKDAAYRLGECYYDGRGIKQNYGEAFKYFQRAYDNGDHKDAAYMLGWCYHDGRGIKQNYGEAFKYFQRAYDNGNHKYAAYMLGWCYHYGNGVEINLSKAYDYYKEADKNGHQYAKYELKSLKMFSDF